MRELRLSLERKPSALPSLKDALAGVMEADGASEESETGKELPKMQRPPPVLDDNLWDEITTEVKRKSMYEPVLVEDDADESEQSAVEEAVTESAPALQEEVTPAASVDAEPSLDDLANHIKAQIGTSFFFGLCFVQ